MYIYTYIQVHVVLADGLLRLQSFRIEESVKSKLEGAARQGGLEGHLTGVCTSCLTPNDPGCDLKIDISREDGNYIFRGNIYMYMYAGIYICICMYVYIYIAAQQQPQCVCI